MHNKNVLPKVKVKFTKEWTIGYLSFVSVMGVIIVLGEMYLR